MTDELEYTPAKPLEGIVLVQGRTEENPFTIGGVHATTNGRTMKVVILSVPTHGTLMTTDQQVLQTGSIVPMPWGESRILVTYHSTDNSFFSLPEPNAETMPDEFKYKVEAHDPRTEELIGSSGPDSLAATQKIHIQNVNHKPNLLVPETSVQQTQSVISGKAMAVISGIEIFDSDKDVNFVRVDLKVESGDLTLNEKFRNLAEFDSCRNLWTAGWQCVGNGINDRKMTFLARPSHINSILTELEYASLFIHQDDSLTVSVFDGVGGDCIAELDQTFSTVRIGPNLTRYTSVQDGCYSVRAFVAIIANQEIYVDPASVDPPINRANALGWAIYIIIFFGVFLVVVLVLRMLCGLGRRMRGASITYG